MCFSVKRFIRVLSLWRANTSQRYRKSSAMKLLPSSHPSSLHIKPHIICLSSSSSSSFNWITVIFIFNNFSVTQVIVHPVLLNANRCTEEQKKLKIQIKSKLLFFLNEVNSEFIKTGVLIQSRLFWSLSVQRVSWWNGWTPTCLTAGYL